MNWAEIVAPTFGIGGVMLGVLLNEVLRRRQRVEQYSSIVFQKRLEAYEALMTLITDSSLVARELIERPDLPSEERLEIVSSIIHTIIKHVENNVLYINEELGTHCTALFMGVEDAAELEGAELEKYLENYRQQLKETRRMILEDSGISQLNRLFHSIHRPTLTSPIIDRVRELRKERRA